jgi:hypothetical protein
MFNNQDGNMQAVPKVTTQLKEDLLFIAMFAEQKLSRYYAESSPTTSPRLIFAHVLN